MFKLRSLAAALFACVLLIAGCGQSHKAVHARTAQPVHNARVLSTQPTSTQAATGSVAPKGWGQTPPGFPLPRLSLTVTPTGEMLDGIFVSDFHGLSPFAVAGYTAGHWPDYVGLHATFPKAHAISIAISARWHADCLDVEPGDAVPSQAGPWVLADIKAGFPKPCLYSDLSEMPAVRASLAASGLKRSQYFLWLAWYRFVPGLVADYDAVQWSDRVNGGALDESTVSLAFLSIAQPPYVEHPLPKPVPKPKPQPWSSAEVQTHGLTATCTVHITKGRWTASKGCRVHSLPFGAKPLGG